LRSKGKALATTLSDEESFSKKSDEESTNSDSDQEGNFIAFKAISDENEKNDFDSKAESEVILEDSADLQDAYNKLCITATHSEKECKSFSI